MESVGRNRHLKSWSRTTVANDVSCRLSNEAKALSDSLQNFEKINFSS